MFVPGQEDKMNNSDTVKALLIRISAGDEGAFGSFYDIYFQKVFQFSRYFIKSEIICQEVVSDVFLKLWQNRKTLTSVEKIETYLYVITKNKAFDYIDKLARKPEFAEDLPLGILSADGSPEDLLLNKELEKVINSAIDNLPERCKLIFLMIRQEGMKYSDVAQILSISEKTINAQMVTAVKKIGEALKNYF